MSEYLEYKIDNNGICIIYIDRPPVNALSSDLLLSIKTLFEKLKQNDTIRVVIIASNNNHFSAGADLKERKIMSIKDSGKALDIFNECFNVIENYPNPVICAINGYCLGGGAELALSCDLRIASDDSMIGFPEVSIGIIPGAGGTQRLSRIIGISKAKYWIYSAKKFTSNESLRYGFINFLIDKKNLINFCKEVAFDIMRNAPIAIKCAKKSINKGYNLSITDGLNVERIEYNISLNTEDRNEALKAFVDKRKPKWSNK